TAGTPPDGHAGWPATSTGLGPHPSPSRSSPPPASSTLLSRGVSFGDFYCGQCWNCGATPEELARLPPRLVEFTAQMLGALPRRDQRAKGELYVRGLLTDGARKSMQPMAARLGVDHQGLQQVVSSSTWDCATVRANVARWAVQAIGPDAYVVDDTG